MEDYENLSIEELWNRLNNETGLEKCELALFLCRALGKNREYSDAIAVAEILLTTSKEINSESFQADAHFQIAWCNVALYRYEEALEAYELALPLALSGGSESFAIRTSLNLADVYWRLKKFYKTLEVVRNILPIAIAYEDDKLLGEAHFWEGKALYRLDSEIEALEALEKSRSAYRSNGSVQSVREVDDYAATVDLYLGNFESATDRLRKCLTVTREETGANNLSYALVRYGHALVRNGEVNEAIAILDEAKAIASEQSNHFRIAQAEYDLASAYEQLDQIDKAIECTYNARALYDYLGRDKDITFCDRLLAEFFWRKGEYGRANLANRRVIAYAERFSGWEFDEYMSRTNIAENHFQAREYEECLKVLQEPQSDSDYEEPRFGLIARLYLQARVAAVQDKWTEAKALAEEAINLTQESDVNFRTPWLFEIVGNELERRGDPDFKEYISQAVALHLAFSHDDHARHLSKRLLPEINRTRNGLCLVPDPTDNE